MYRCSVDIADTSIAYSPYVDVEIVTPTSQVLSQPPTIQFDLSRLLSVECNGPNGSDVILYLVDANLDESPEIVKCFQQVSKGKRFWLFP